MKQPSTGGTSPFDWQGQPSIFTTGAWKSTQDFSGINTNRAIPRATEVGKMCSAKLIKKKPKGTP